LVFEKIAKIGQNRQNIDVNIDPKDVAPKTRLSKDIFHFKSQSTKYSRPHDPSLCRQTALGFSRSLCSGAIVLIFEIFYKLTKPGDFYSKYTQQFILLNSTHKTSLKRFLN
jgi:Zn-dependent peptidase ImmA (M78 family)